jgi:16S rRNA (guanine1516-N2)-methyltransferase
MTNPPRCAVGLAAEPERAQALAAQLHLPLCTADCADFTWVLSYEDGHLAIQETGHTSGGALWIDFTGGRAAHRRQFGGGRGQPLARALGLKGGANPTVVDATAGLGRDGFVLASLGARVTLLERSPILAALLADGLARATSHAEVGGTILPRVQLINTDSRDWLRHCPAAQRPDVVYLDPMYPAREKSALVKKEMRFLQALVGKDEDAAELLAAALTCASKRVVVKRPKGAPPLAGPLPSGAVVSKNTRYDIYAAGG